MATQNTLYTADDLLRLPDTGKRYELVKGELVEITPTGGPHGRTASKIDRRVGTFVEANHLGEVFAAETGFRIHRNPDTVRAPDVAFVSRERLPEPFPPGFLELTPDLVVEVVSPSDTAAAVQAKVEEWLRAGARMVLLAYPDSKSLAVYRGLNDVRVLTEADDLHGDPVLPGFLCPVRDLF